MTNATTPTLNEVHALYHAAMAADAVVEAALVAAYGPKRAPESRYRQNHPQAVQAAFQANRDALGAYFAACRLRNVDPNEVADQAASAQVEPNPDGVDYLPPDDPGPVDVDDADVPY